MTMQTTTNEFKMKLEAYVTLYNEPNVSRAVEFKQRRMTMSDKEDFLVDCVITAGETDPNWYGKWLDNDLKHFEVVKHNVPYSQFKEWMNSPERWKRVRALEQIGKDRFGKDWWMKYRVCCFCTTPHKEV